MISFRTTFRCNICILISNRLFGENKNDVSTWSFFYKTYCQGRQTSQCTQCTCTCTVCFFSIEASKCPKIPGPEASKSQNTPKLLASKPRALPVFSLDWRPCLLYLPAVTILRSISSI